MRPAGEIRRAALQAAWDVAVERAMQPVPGVTRADVLARLVPKGVGRRVAVATWENLVRAGQLRPVGKVRLPDAPRPLQAYLPVGERSASAALASACPAQQLGGVTRAWVYTR